GGGRRLLAAARGERERGEDRKTGSDHRRRCYAIADPRAVRHAPRSSPASATSMSGSRTDGAARGADRREIERGGLARAVLEEGMMYRWIAFVVTGLTLG